MKKLLLLAVSGSFLLTQAQVIHVSAAASVGGDGSKAKPFAKIQPALDKAMPGDTVELAPGVYYERVKFPRSGKYQKPIRLNGPRSAIIDGSIRFKQEWKKIPEYGPNAWHTKVPAELFPSQVEHKGSGLVVSPQGSIIQLYEKRVGNLKIATKDPHNTWYAPELMTKGIGKTKMSFIQALAMYRHKQQDVIVSYGDGRDVSKEKIVFSPPLPSIVIDGVDRCVVSGITIRHSYLGVRVKNSLGTVIEDCRIMRSDRGIELSQNCDRCTVRFCDISMDPLFGCDPWKKGSWDAWKGHKIGGFWDRIAINIVNSKGGHRIHDNYLHNHWGGVQDAGDNPDLDVHHNFIADIEDDALEPNGTNRNCRWHHNRIINSRCAFRIKCIQKGPMYAYANAFFNCKEDFRNYKQHQYPDAIAYIYHNTSNATVGIKNNSVKTPPGLKNFHYLNNIFVCDAIYGGSNALNWTDAGNTYFRRTNSSLWKLSIDKAKSFGFRSSSKFFDHANHGIRDFKNGDFSLQECSPARNAGIDLSKFALPGIEEFSSRDSGAVPYGKAMFKTYRDKSTLTYPPAGSWPQENEGEK